MPERVGHHRDAGVADLHDLLHALHAGDLGGVEALHLAAEHRAILDRGAQHAGQLEVDGVLHRAIDLRHRVEPLERLAGNLPVLGVLELRLLRNRKLGGRSGNLAVGGRLARGLVRDDALVGRQLCGRHLPLVGCGLDQHQAGGGAAFAHILMRLANRAAAGGVVVAPRALALHIVARRRIFGRDLGPVAIEFLGDELGEAGLRALAHLGPGDARSKRPQGA